ncbi:MAG: carboxyltransferase domain-containing protein [Paracoccus sp. (in: a-proteobacteria)]|uniref:5-oxoprolinase subunit B family protein n=1 Tax=Paracoccus sp. TaxID=267 RepID=UPI0026E07AB9|nr:carboxyltransferase domain-containing protein [Paracoccus sp. (in: a-proteobacteria)]MDO5620984.1 carboxyltransferase domain-containing protein [Paracoccus sp. (in: a-proteobacteria)]
MQVQAQLLADRAVTFRLGAQISPQVAAQVRAADAAIAAALAAGALPGACESAPSFCAVTVHYDPLQTDPQALIAAVSALLEPLDGAAGLLGREWVLPCYYNGMDLADLEVALNLPAAQIVAAHAATVFDVYALGFLPGLPFMGSLPKGLSLPRRASPRSRVPAGAVAIANGLSVIYPSASPGGWHIVGHCPVPLFDARRDRPALLAPGDRVRFRAVEQGESDQIAADLAAGRLDPDSMGAACS